MIKPLTGENTSLQDTSPLPQSHQSVQTGNGGRGVKLYSYSQLFYYWPVWVVSLILGGILYYVKEPPLQAYYGLIFVGVLIYTITATSISIRGLWFLLLSALFLILVLLAVMFEMHDEILMYVLNLKLDANAGLYLTIGTVLFSFWFVTTFVYDRLRYVKVGQNRTTVVHATGEGIKDFDNLGMRREKRRDNFAQHWILGFGSADIILRPRNADPIFVQNVLGGRRKLQKIDKLLNG